MSAMSEMSRAIRLVVQAHAPTLRDLERDTLNEFVEIVHAFAADLRDEQLRRTQASLRCRSGEAIAVQQRIEDIRFAIVTLATFISLTIPSAAGAENSAPGGAPTPSGDSRAQRVPPRVAGAEHCPQNRAGLRWYVTRTNHWLGKRGVRFLAASPSSTSCAYTQWLAKRWRSRSWQARQAWERFQERRYVLRDFRVTAGSNAWRRAVQEVQGPYPGTEAWLLSCSASEGGWGRWVPNSQGSGVGGWMQMFPSTFWRMFSAAKADAERRGYRVPSSAASWYSPIGQALGGAWAIQNGRRHEWVGAGCA